MRPVFLLAGVALTLAACGSKDQSGNNATIDDSLTAENIVANDVTAIDAVTADAANMAADVDFANELDNNVTGNAASAAAPAKPAKPATTTVRPATPAANQAGNATD